MTKGNLIVGGLSRYCNKLLRDTERTLAKISLIRPIL